MTYSKGAGYYAGVSRFIAKTYTRFRGAGLYPILYKFCPILAFYTQTTSCKLSYY